MKAMNEWQRSLPNANMGARLMYSPSTWKPMPRAAYERRADELEYIRYSMFAGIYLGNEKTDYKGPRLRS